MNFNTKTKKLLAIAVSLVLVASAIFFAIYGAIGQTFRYSKRNLEKFVSELKYEGIDISAATLKEVDEKAVTEQIAKLLASKANTTVSTSAVADGVDLVLICYYATDAEGNVITDPALMDPAKAVKVQLGSSERLAEILGEVLTNIKPKDYSYNVYSEGFPYGEVGFVSYLPTGGTEVKFKQVAFTEAAVDALLGTGAYAALSVEGIGTKLSSKTFGDKTYDYVQLNWVARSEFNGGSTEGESNIAAGDTVYAKVTTTNSSKETVTYYVCTDGTNTKIFTGINKNATLDSAVIDAILASGYKGKGAVSYHTWKDLTAFEDGKTYYTYNDTDKRYVEVDRTTVTAPAAGTTYYTSIGEHKYEIQSIVRPGMTAEQTTSAMAGVQTTYTYAADATDKDVAGNELKGKTVTFHAFPIGVYEVELTAKNIVTLTTTLTSEEGTALIAAYNKYTAFDKAETELQTLLGTTNTEKFNAYVAAMRTFKDSTEATPDRTALDAARKAITDLDATKAADYTAKMDAIEKAYDEMVAEIKKYDADANTAAITSHVEYFDKEANEILPKDTETALKEANVATYKADVAKILWEKILADTTVELPRRAVRLAYREQLNTHKQTYYEKKYTEYSSFSKYMAATVGADYKATVKAEAEAVVRELVLVYYLADVLGVEINDTLVNEYYQNSNMYIYYYYYYGSFPEQFETAYVFDKVVEGLLSKYTLASYPEA